MVKKFNKGTFYKCCIVEPMSCQCELSAGMYNRWCSQCAVWLPCCSYFRRRHLLYFEAFTMGDLQRAFLFAEKGWSNQIQNSWTMPTKRLTAGLAWGNVCVDSWAPWQPFVFSQVSFQLLWFNFYTHVASHFNLASINSLNVEAILMWLFINVEAVHY